MGPQGHYQLEDGLYDKPRSRKKTYLYAALVLLLLIAAGVGIGVVVSRLTDVLSAGKRNKVLEIRFFVEENSSPASSPTTADSGADTFAASGSGDSRNSETGEAVSTGSGSPATTTPASPSTGTPTSGTPSGPSDGAPPGTRIFPGAPPASATPTPTQPVSPSPPAVATPPGVPASPTVPTPPVAPTPPVVNTTVPVDPEVVPPVVPVTPVASPPNVTAPPAVPAGPPVAVPPAEVQTIASGEPSNTWTPLPDVPLPMGEVGAGVLTLNDNPYLVIAGEHPTQEEEKNGVTMILDLTGGQWYEGAKRPAIGNHHAAEVIKNKLYLFGGLSGGEQDLQIGTLVPGTAGPNISWKKGAALPFASGSASTALINGKVYYCGGINKANTATVDTCAVYTPSTNSWSTAVAPMPQGRNHAATCTDGKKMYVFGGRSGKNQVGEGFGDTQIYDPATNTWAAGTPLKVPRGGMGKAVYDAGKCFVFGGEVWENDLPSEVNKITPARVSVATDIYTIGSDAWSSGEDLPVGLHGSFPVKYDGVALLASGGVEAAYSQSQNAIAYTL